MRENEQRGMNPSAYSTPASAFNTLSVDFVGGIGTLGSPKRKLKTKLFPNLSVDQQATGEGGNASSQLMMDGGATALLNQNCSTLSSLHSLGTMSTSSSSDICNMSYSTPSGSKPASNYGTLDKVSDQFSNLSFQVHLPQRFF